ncbi:MAG: hypothetical protein ACRD0J_11065 [Acidimicrobiales bacterium]
MDVVSKEAARAGARALAVGRIALGLAALVIPSLPARAWLGGEAGRSKPVKVLARALGGRDLALGLGTILALRHDAPVRGWVEAGGLADAGDLVATLAGWRSLPAPARLGVAALTAGGVAAARLLSGSVDKVQP